MHITKPHCTCLMLSDREHAVRWRRSRRGEKWEIRSLVERLKALEHTDQRPDLTGTRVEFLRGTRTRAGQATTWATRTTPPRRRRPIARRLGSSAPAA